jgi:ArsR family transcriptional regulator
MGFVKDERQEQFIFYDLNLNDKVYKAILEKIVDNIDDYPELKSDIEKCHDAEKYIVAYRK